MPSESDKKTWEKERRGRIKEAFITLEKLLPSYDPSAVSTRINILNKSIEYIQEMQSRIEELLKPSSKINTEVLQLKKLQERIKRLLSRNELLSSLLKEAKISIPNQGSALKTFRYGYKWSGKISGKMAIDIQRKTRENEKENKNSGRELLKLSKPNKKIRNKLNSSSLVPKHRKNIVNRSENSNGIETRKKLLHPVSTNCFIIYTQGCNTQPCYLVTNAPSHNLASISQTVITNSLITSSPLMSTNIKSTKKAVIQPTVGTSTLILANGTLYPVLPQSQPIIPTQMVFQVANNSSPEVKKSQSIANNLETVSEANKSNRDTNVNRKSDASSGVDAMKNLSAINDSKKCSILSSSSSSSNTPDTNIATLSAKDIILSRNVAIRPNRCITKTTHVNKVPIPALTSSFCTSILVPEISKSIVLKKNNTIKRIGNKPMGRQALRKLRKMVSKRKMEIEVESVENVKAKSFMKTIEDKLTPENTLNQKNNLTLSLPSTTTFPLNTTNTPTTVSLVNNQSVQHSQINLVQDIDNQKSCNSKVQLDGQHYKVPIISNDAIKNPESSQISFNSGASGLCLKSTPDEYNKKYQETNLSEKRCPDIDKTRLNICNNINTSVANMNSQQPTVIEQSDQENTLKNNDLMNIESNSSKIICNIGSSAQIYTGDAQNKLSTQNIQIPKKEKNVKLDDNAQNFLENHQSNQNNNQRNENSLNVENVCHLNQQMKNFDLQLGNSELSNDLFDSLQVPPGCQNPESTSPTAAFLLAFPLVSSLTGVKVTEVMDDDNTDSQRETPTLLQIGTLDNTKPTQSPNLFNLDNLSFFSSKDIYSGFYNSFEQHLNALTMSTNTFVSDSSKVTEKSTISTCLPKVGKTEEHLKVSSNQNIQKGKKSCNIESNKNSLSKINSNEQPNISVEKEVDKQPNKSQNTIIQQQNTPSLDLTPQKLSVTSNPGNQSIQNNSMQANISNQNDTFGGNKTVENVNKNLKHEEFISIRGNVHSDASKNIESIKYFGNDSIAPTDKDIFHNFNSKRGNFVASITQASNNANVFNIDSRNRQLPATQKNVEQTNISFPPQKQNFPMQKNFDGQMCSQVSNIQPSIQKNTQNAQLSFVENRNLVPATSQSNFGYNLFSMDNTIPSCLQKNVNYKNLNCNSEDKYSGLQKDFNRTFFTSEILPSLKDFNNLENMDIENQSIRINETSQKNIYNHQLEYKNVIPVSTQKVPDINFSFNLVNTVPPPLPKTVESKQLFLNYVPDANVNYDLNSTTKVCTCAYSMNKKIPDPLYTNSNNSNYNYYSNSENFLNENCFKNTKNDKAIGSIDFENFTDYRKTDYANTYYHDHNFQKNVVASTKSNSHNEKITYNWMTAPSKNSLEQSIAAFPKEDVVHSSHNILNNNQTTYFNAPIYTGEISSNLGQTTRKNLDLPLMNANTNLQRNDIEDNHFTWSPSKVPQYLDPVPNFVSSTLPTLVGDLALGTSSYSEQKLDSNKFSNNRDVKNKATSRLNYENQSNLFSVSQLVHQNKEIAPAKPVRRRSSGSGSKGHLPKNKKASKLSEDQKEVQCFTKSPGHQSHQKSDKNLICRQPNNNIFCDLNKKNPVKVASSNYTAEALIGNQGNSDVISKREHIYNSTVKNMPVPPFISENIMPYFPAVDMPQDNFIQQNQNYQNFSHNFTTFSNASYSTNTFIPSCTITTTYLNTNTFMPDLGSGHDFSTSNMNLFPNAGMTKDNKNKNISKSNTNCREEKNTHNHPFPSNVGKKVKRKATNESSVTPNLVDFTFLSAPGNINSPLLPDDFHSHTTFLPPPPTQPQLYPCKNPIYPTKQSNINSVPLLPVPPIPTVTRAGIQHPEVSPSLNSGGTSLTNFNLSTIFPEINKGSINEIYSDNRVKDHAVTTHYPSSSVSTEF